MTEDRTAETTRLLAQVRAGETGAAERLMPFLYDELRDIARRLMAGERGEHTLQPTALISEAAVRLLGNPNQTYDDRVHVLRVAARAMRNVLVDHARTKGAAKRGGGGRVKVTLDEGLVITSGRSESLLVVHETLERLAEVDPQLSQVVELRFFGGLKDAEIAAAIGVSERTVQRDWRMARAWLAREMASADARDGED